MDVFSLKKKLFFYQNLFMSNSGMLLMQLRAMYNYNTKRSTVVLPYFSLQTNMSECDIWKMYHKVVAQCKENNDPQLLEMLSQHGMIQEVHRDIYDMSVSLLRNTGKDLAYYDRQLYSKNRKNASYAAVLHNVICKAMQRYCLFGEMISVLRKQYESSVQQYHNARDFDKMLIVLQNDYRCNEMQKHCMKMLEQSILLARYLTIPEENYSRVIQNNLRIVRNSGSSNQRMHIFHSLTCNVVSSVCSSSTTRGKYEDCDKEKYESARQQYEYTDEDRKKADRAINNFALSVNEDTTKLLKIDISVDDVFTQFVEKHIDLIDTCMSLKSIIEENDKICNGNTTQIPDEERLASLNARLEYIDKLYNDMQYLQISMSEYQLSVFSYDEEMANLNSTIEFLKKDADRCKALINKCNTKNTHVSSPKVQEEGVAPLKCAASQSQVKQVVHHLPQAREVKVEEFSFQEGLLSLRINVESFLGNVQEKSSNIDIVRYKSIKESADLLLGKLAMLSETARDESMIKINSMITAVNKTMCGVRNNFYRSDAEAPKSFVEKRQNNMHCATASTVNHGRCKDEERVYTLYLQILNVCERPLSMGERDYNVEINKISEKMVTISGNALCHLTQSLLNNIYDIKEIVDQVLDLGCTENNISWAVGNRVGYVVKCLLSVHALIPESHRKKYNEIQVALDKLLSISWVNGCYDCSMKCPNREMQERYNNVTVFANAIRYIRVTSKNVISIYQQKCRPILDFPKRTSGGSAIVQEDREELHKYLDDMQRNKNACMDAMRSCQRMLNELYVASGVSVGQNIVRHEEMIKSMNKCIANVQVFLSSCGIEHNIPHQKMESRMQPPHRKQATVIDKQKMRPQTFIKPLPDAERVTESGNYMCPNPAIMKASVPNSCKYVKKPCHVENISFSDTQKIVQQDKQKCLEALDMLFACHKKYKTRKESFQKEYGHYDHRYFEGVRKGCFNSMLHYYREAEVLFLNFGKEDKEGIREKLDNAYTCLQNIVIEYSAFLTAVQDLSHVEILSFDMPDRY